MQADYPLRHLQRQKIRHRKKRIPSVTKKSGLKPGQADKLLTQLQKYMQENKPYLDHKLTLTVLANELEIHPNYLSQVINEKLDVNFYDFVNKARLDEFITLVQKPKSTTLHHFGACPG